ncbi:MAG: thioredoxin domain-containing protein [Gemmataceae bacterium]
MRLALVLPLSILMARPGIAEEKPPAGPANRLAKESSPYLRQHGHNPVDWYPWGTEAFEKAKKENKLVFLSIGYSSCHWCHVMERESFSNADVAKILNDSFVSIKVDREERPDIDEIYMEALHVLDQRGGWPLSMFLTADAKPIVGGTYWPPDDREVQGEKVRGFKTILKMMVKFHTEQPKEIAKQADSVAEETNKQLGRRSRAKVAINRTLLTAATAELTDQFDDQYGGFGNKARQFRGSKFPMAVYLTFLQAELKRTKAKDLKKVIDLTLEKMARGGVFDQMGGGFHRYSTERTWTVPHFEKMLYDNAQLAEVYATAHAADPKPLYARTLRATLDFVLREMTAPEGGFYSALDADSEGEEGRFYVWSPKDLEAALPDREELALARAVYGVDRGLNFEEKYSILTLPEPLADIAAKQKMTANELDARLTVIREKLLAVRSKRPRPFLDTKVLTAWNGQMIAGFAAAGKALNEPKYTDAAKKAAEFVLKSLRTKDGRLLRSYLDAGRLNGYLDDYAFLTHGLLALHDATGEARWLAEAKALTDTMVKWHSDAEFGGFFYTSHDHEKLFARSKDQYDGAQPSGNSMAALNLVRLAAKTGDASYRELAKKSFESFGQALQTNPTGLTTMLLAAGEMMEQEGAKPPGNK